MEITVFDDPPLTLDQTSRSTPIIQDPHTNGSVAIKQEEDDSSAVRSLQVSRSSTSATPDPSVTMRPSENVEERYDAIAAVQPHGEAYTL